MLFKINLNKTKILIKLIKFKIFIIIKYIMNIINLSIIFIISLIIAIIYKNQSKDNLIENFSPIITRYQNATENQNTCPTPFTNNKRDKECSKPVYTYQYSNRMLLSPNDYENMVKNLLKDLSQGNPTKLNLNNNNLEELEYKGDQNQFQNFFNNKLKNLIQTKTYLQNNGGWKYESFFVSEFTIFFYKLKDNPNYFIFKLMYILQNPLRSSYTNCYAFVSLKNPLLNNLNGIGDNLNIIKTAIVSENNNIDNFTDSENNQNYYNNENAINNIQKGDLNFSFLNVMPQFEYDQWGNGVNNSGIPYISEYREGTKVDIKPSIPTEFTENDFKAQYLPPQFGNGIVNYPPIYELKNGQKNFVNTPPLY